MTDYIFKRSLYDEAGGTHRLEAGFGGSWDQWLMVIGPDCAGWSAAARVQVG